MSYYGVILDIIELRYTGGNKIVLCRCDQYDILQKGIGYEKDHYGIVSVSMTRKLYINKPFVLASQSSLLYYMFERSYMGYSYWEDAKKIFMKYQKMKMSHTKKTI